MGRNSRYLIIIPAVLFALFAKPAKADTLGEWTYSQSCPTSGSVEVIDDTIILHGPDQGGCSGQPHWVKIETTIPADVDTVDFTWAYQTNDGAWYDPPQYAVNDVYVQLTTQSNATGSLSIPVEEGDVFTFRQYSTDTCCAPGHLTISNLSLWASITSSTTSTTTSTTTVPPSTVPATVPTTTTVQETTTTSSTTTTTTVPQTTTSVENSTSTTSSTTTSSVPQTTTTESTTTTTQPPAVPTPVTQPQISEPTPVEPSVPVKPEPDETTTTTTEVEATTTTDLPPGETTTTTEPSPDPTLPEAPETPSEAPLSDEQVDSLIAEAETTEALVEALAELSPEQVEQVLETLLAEEPTEEQATALASSPEVLAIVSTEQAQQIFEALDVGELSDAQTEELIAAIESAPTEIREEFEDTIDIFGEGLDDYTPTGSTIPVGERRTLIAVTAGITLAAAGTRIRR